MLSLALNLVYGVVIAILAIVSLKTIVSWWRLQFYKKQGIKVIFAPLKGENEFYYNTSHAENKLNSSNYLTRIVAENKDSPCIAINDAISTVPLLLIHDPEYKKAYYAIETDVSEKFFPLTMAKETNPFGFLFQNGEKVKKHRIIFAKIFGAENLNKFISEIHRLLEAEVNSLRQEIGKTAG